eukprot:snap_masked-scaffold_59-processed-gene-0.92-mRNA-1 protein AED:1.00 eAED:1.00 QI:0/-1/0/0/-1/1/1/0/125
MWRRLRLNISKCDFLKKKTTFCGNLLTDKGHRLDKKYVADLLGRRKPKYVHEVTQFIFIGNLITEILPHFAWLRFTLTENYLIVEKIKVLERKKKTHHLDKRDQYGVKGVGREAERVVHGNIGIF